VSTQPYLALISVELAIRGHLSPGGGFAAGVAGGTAIGLVAITSSSDWMEHLYQRWQAATWEKVSVLVFIVLSVLSLVGLELPQGELGTLVSGSWIPLLNILVAIKVALGSWAAIGSWIPLLNILVAIKVALGSWAAILVFIRYRGLL
jgi:multicomponent Na+:H+ antiporter subunit B